MPDMPQDTRSRIYLFEQAIALRGMYDSVRVHLFFLTSSYKIRTAIIWWAVLLSTVQLHIYDRKLSHLRAFVDIYILTYRKRKRATLASLVPTILGNIELSTKVT